MTVTIAAKSIYQKKNAPLALSHSSYLVAAIFLFFSLSISASIDNKAAIKTQTPLDTALYQKTLTAIKKGHRSNTKTGLKALTNHPLYPYLEKAQLEKKLSTLPYSEVDQFLDRYDNAVVAQQLHKKWLNTLARKKIWGRYLDYYQPRIANNELRCLYLEALHQKGLTTAALSQTADLWLTAKSLPDACNSSFKRWEQAGLKTDDLVWQRTLLALQANNTLLARYLSKYASADLKPHTRRLINVHRRPFHLEATDEFSKLDHYTTDIVTHGLKRLASRDFDLTTSLWVYYRGVINFDANQHTTIRDKIARQIIASGSEQALDWLINHDPNADDDYLMEWRIRLALRGEQWKQAEQWINMLPNSHQQQPRWRYWSARANQFLGNPHKSQALLKQLASERHYYGFLAADQLQEAYDFNHNQLLEEDATSDLSQIAAIQRAQAFFHMNDLVAARREWFSAINGLNRDELLSATQMAHQWGWHQQAIMTTIKAEHLDDLSIRFPLAYHSDMSHFADSTSINLEWLYAIARQESAFAEDAYSSAGARGLMQLRPSTAKLVAKQLGVKFNSYDLYRPEKNIALGSNYLKQLLEKYKGNRILATAAYNAGPHRVNRWLRSQSASLPYDVWIETLPFHETRNYVQNVLAFSVIYGHRLGTNSRLINEQESIIRQPLSSSSSL